MNNNPEIQAPSELNLPDISHQQKLIILLEFIKKYFTPERNENMAALNIFMEWLGTLYLDYFQHHLDEAESIGKKYEPLLLNLIGPIVEDYVRAFSSSAMLSSDPDEYWYWGCCVKTEVEAFQDMFRGITGKLEGGSMDLLDEYLEEPRNQLLDSKDQVPKNIPEHHWWWFMVLGEKMEIDEQGNFF